MEDLPQTDFTKEITISVFDAKMIITLLKSTQITCVKSRETLASQLIKYDIKRIKEILKLEQ